MKLILYRDDLLPEHKDVPCSETRLEHFKWQGRLAIMAIGSGRFEEYDGSNYNVVLCPPRKDSGQD